MNEKNNLVLFSGNSNPELATKIAKKLNISLGKALVDKFSDNELNIRVDEHVRGKMCLFYSLLVIQQTIT